MPVEYHESRKHSELRKCKFCRRDKRKCTPANRIWPSQRCNSCEKYDYTCSAGLNAKEQRAARNNPTNAEVAVQYEHLPNDVPVSSGDPQLHAPADSRNALEESGVQQVELHQVSRSERSSGDERMDRLVESPDCARLSRTVPSNHHIQNNVTYRLNKRLCELWGDRSTYDIICSERFGTTLSDLFFYNCRQIASVEPMVYNALFAFSAADASINGDWASRIEFEIESRTYYSKAIRTLQKKVTSIGDRQQRNKTPNIVPILYTIFLLAAYGTCANNADTLRFMAWLMEDMRKKSGAFPLRMHLEDLPEDGWRFRVYLADDPKDSGLICGHDTTLFDGARNRFEESLVCDTTTRLSEIP